MKEGLAKVEKLLRCLAGQFEDLSADDATWGYPNDFAELMYEFGNLAGRVEKLENIYTFLDSKMKLAINKAVANAFDEENFVNDSPDDFSDDFSDEAIPLEECEECENIHKNSTLTSTDVFDFNL